MLNFLGIEKGDMKISEVVLKPDKTIMKMG
jgi:hypothetical protein